jgi:hypothetical protein
LIYQITALYLKNNECQHHAVFHHGQKKKDFVDTLIRASITNRYNLDGQIGVLWQRAKKESSRQKN